MTVSAQLLTFIKKHIRLSTDALDDEVSALIEAAVSDMNMRGIDTEKLIPDGAAINELNPLIVRAIVYYAKANFGIANNVAETDQYRAGYEGLSQALSNASDTRIPIKAG